MKVLAFLAFLFVLTANQAIAQSQSFQIARIGSANKAVPGQIVAASVEGLGQSTFLEAKDFSFELTQNTTKLKSPGRTATLALIPETPGDSSAFRKMKSVQQVSFLIPKGLLSGDASVVVIYRKQRSVPAKLLILERPETPILGITRIALSDSLGSVPTTGNNVEPGWRLERGRKTELSVQPLIDPNDSQSAILVRFKQRDNVFQAASRVVHQEAKVEQLSEGVKFSPSRDFLEVTVPRELEVGPAQAEVQVRINGQTSGAAIMPALITDVKGNVPSPENAPNIDPKRVGAGQALMISGDDRLLALKRDPSRAMVMFEKDGVSYTVKPEMNSAEIGLSKNDGLVFLIVRPTRQLIGMVQVRLVNSRSEQGGVSGATTIEVVDDVLPPELTSVTESTTEELGQLRVMYEAQRNLGREFAEYNPTNRYLSIRARGLDLKSKYVKITLEQDERNVLLKEADFSLRGGDLTIVRLPKGFSKGQVIISVQNKGTNKLSTAATMKFELSR